MTHICVTRPGWIHKCIIRPSKEDTCIDGYKHVLGQYLVRVVIDPSRKSHNASNKYPTMHHFITEMCTHVHISVTKRCIVGFWTGAFWELWVCAIAALYAVSCLGGACYTGTCLNNTITDAKENRNDNDNDDNVDDDCGYRYDCSEHILFYIFHITYSIYWLSWP